MEDSPSLHNKDLSVEDDSKEQGSGSAASVAMQQLSPPTSSAYSPITSGPSSPSSSGAQTASSPTRLRSTSDEEDQSEKSKDIQQYIYIVSRVDGKETKPWRAHNLLGAFRTLPDAQMYTKREHVHLVQMFAIDEYGRAPYVIKQVPIFESWKVAPDAQAAEMFGLKSPAW